MARNWTMVEPLHNLLPVDVSGFDEVYEFDPFFFTPSPTFSPPSAAPSTDSPSASPTDMPTITSSPTSRPTKSPTGLPTAAPTIVPTVPPTPGPTTPRPSVMPYFPEVPPPLNPDEAFFNYDRRPYARYGPGNRQLVYIRPNVTQTQYGNNGWIRVSTKYYNYWNEFGDNGFGAWNGTLSNRNVETNMCGKTGNQSPIDLKETPDSKCYETHQVRSRVSLQRAF